MAHIFELSLTYYSSVVPCLSDADPAMDSLHRRVRGHLGLLL